jgi:hypothetical protein
MRRLGKRDVRVLHSTAAASIVRQTVTMKIMASCSRESSLHAMVRAGFPMGTNSKPGGGSFFSVN